MARLTNEDLQRRLLLKGLETLLAESPVFRKFLWTILRDLGTFTSSYSRGSAVDTTYQVGRRDAGLEIVHFLKHVRTDVLGLLEREGNLMSEVSAPTPKPGDDNEPENPTNDDDDERDGEPFA